MRVIIILIVVAVALVIVQHQRNGCQWGEPGWMSCIMSFDGASNEPDVSP